MNFFISQKTLAIYGTLFLTAIILGVIVGIKMSDGGLGLYTALAVATFGLFPFVKKLVLYIGRLAVDFATTVDLIFVMTILVAGVFYKANGGGFYGELVSYWWFVLAAFLYLVFAALKNYTLYLLVDIRDSLHKLAFGTSSEYADDNILTDEPKDDTKICPNCGKQIKKTAKKCRYCDTWLEERNAANNQA